MEVLYVFMFTECNTLRARYSYVLEAYVVANKRKITSGIAYHAVNLRTAQLTVMETSGIHTYISFASYNIEIISMVWYCT